MSRIYQFGILFHKALPSLVANCMFFEVWFCKTARELVELICSILCLQTNAYFAWTSFLLPILASVFDHLCEYQKLSNNGLAARLEFIEMSGSFPTIWKLAEIRRCMVFISILRHA